MGSQMLEQSQVAHLNLALWLTRNTANAGESVSGVYAVSGYDRQECSRIDQIRGINHLHLVRFVLKNAL